MPSAVSLMKIFLLVQALLFFTAVDAFSRSPKLSLGEHLRLENVFTHSTQPQEIVRSPLVTKTSPTQLNMVWKTKDPRGVAMDFPKTKTRFVATMLATLATWHCIVAQGMSPVMSSAATTLAITMWSPGLGQAAFCGSFAGMTSAGTYASTSLIALLNAILFEIVVHRENKWLGLGGRLGMIAFVANNIVADVLGRPHAMIQVPLSLRQWWSVLLKSPWKYGLLCGAIGSVATIVLREVAENAPNIDNDLRDPVRAAAVVGLFASLSVGLGLGANTLDNFGALLVFGGTFTGMCLPSRLLTGVVPGDKYKNAADKKERKPPGAKSIVFGYALAGGLGGLIHALTIPLDWWTGGIWGGKAGACAFAGVCLFRGLEKILLTVRESLGWIKVGELNGGRKEGKVLVTENKKDPEASSA